MLWYPTYPSSLFRCHFVHRCLFALHHIPLFPMSDKRPWVFSYCTVRTETIGINRFFFHVVRMFWEVECVTLAWECSETLEKVNRVQSWMSNEAFYLHFQHSRQYFILFLFPMLPSKWAFKLFFANCTKIIYTPWYSIHGVVEFLFYFWLQYYLIFSEKVRKTNSNL